MKNGKLYVIIIMISVLLMIPALWYGNCAILNALSGIGASGIAAAIMAILIENNEAKKEGEYLKKVRCSYFESINSEICMLLGKIIWLDKKMEDDAFDWSLPPKTYITYQYMQLASKESEQDELEFEKAKMQLEKIAKKYTLENQKVMPENKQEKTYKMFEIIACSMELLIRLTSEMKRDEILLNQNDYVTLNEIKTLCYKIITAEGMMKKHGWNYALAIQYIVEVAEMVREKGEFTDKIKVGLTGPIKIDEM